MNKFEQNGSIFNAPSSGRPASITDESTEDEVSSILTTELQTSTRCMSTLLNIPRTSIRRIYKNFGYKAYMPRLVHELNEDDYDRRVNFCETFLSLFDEEPDLINLIIWSDETTFKLNDHVNRHNSVYWATQNSNVKWEQTMQAEGVTVWAGIWSRGVMDPFYFERTVTSQSYVSRLNDYFYPIFRRLPNKQSLFLTQDDASPHYALDVRDWLDQKFPGRWIGCCGPIEWPVRSPDLTPADFFLWGHIKEIVYKNKPESLAHLKQSIDLAFQTLDFDLCEKVCQSVPNRLQQCIDVDRHRFEHLS